MAKSDSNIIEITDKTPQVPTTVQFNEEPHLPPVKEWLVESKERLVKVMPKMLGLTFVSFLAQMAAMFIFGVIFSLSGMGSVLKPMMNVLRMVGQKGSDLQVQQAMQSFESSVQQHVVPLVTILVAYCLVYWLIILVVGIMQILIIGRKQGISFGDAFKQSWPLVIPLVICQLVYGFLVLGAMWLFYLPALIVMIFISYIAYEVILQKVSIGSALRNSVYLVKDNFGDLFVRFIVQILGVIAYYVVRYFLQQLAVDLHSPALSLILSLIFLITDTLFMWFLTVTSFISYEHARAKSKLPGNNSIVWVIVLAVVGWIFFAVIMASVSKYLPTFTEGVKEGFTRAMQENNGRTRTNPDESVIDSEVKGMYPTQCGFSVPLLGTKDGEGKDERSWMVEERPIDSDAFYLLPEVANSGKSILLTNLAFKKESEAMPWTGSMQLNKPGFNILCVSNDRGFSLDELKAKIVANSKVTIKGTKEYKLGDLELVNYQLEYKDSGDIVYIGVSPDEKRVLMIRSWDADEKDPAYDQIDNDLQTIWEGLTARDSEDSIVMPVPPKGAVAPAKSSTQKAPAQNCVQMNIREGTFASNKCYAPKDYDDLQYYLNQYNNAAFTINSANSSMRITCNGSDFFKDTCERDKAEKSKAEGDLSRYESTVRGIINKGK